MQWTVIHLSRFCEYLLEKADLMSTRSDNGTTVAGINESKKALQEMDQEQISCYLLQNGTDRSIWYKGQLGASYMGVVWDRLWNLTGVCESESH